MHINGWHGVVASIAVALFASTIPIGLKVAGAEDLNALRATIERQIKDEFDEALESFRKTALTNNPHAADNTSDWLLATDGIKSFFYNKAYNLYFCEKANADPSLPSEIAAKRFDTCTRERNENLLITYKIGMQYQSFLQGQGQREVQCELKSRLFDAEFEFPPFEFLRQSRGQDELFDFTVLNACLKSLGP